MFQEKLPISGPHSRKGGFYGSETVWGISRGLSFVFCSSLFPSPAENPVAVVGMMTAIDEQVPKTLREGIFLTDQRNCSFKSMVAGGGGWCEGGGGSPVMLLSLSPSNFSTPLPFSPLCLLTAQH